MNKKLIKQLANASYKDNALNEKKVYKISKLLSRQELKEYIKILKTIENQKKVTVFVPQSFTNSQIKAQLLKQFPKKNIVFQEDPSLIVGLKIVNNDLEYELNLKNTFEKLFTYINE